MFQDYQAAKKASIAYVQDLMMHWENLAKKYYGRVKELEEENEKIRSHNSGILAPHPELHLLRSELDRTREEYRAKSAELSDIKARLKNLFSHTRTLIALANFHETKSNKSWKKPEENLQSSIDQSDSDDKGKKYSEKKPLKEALSEVYSWFKEGKHLNFDNQGRKPYSFARLDVPLMEMMQKRTQNVSPNLEERKKPQEGMISTASNQHYELAGLGKRMPSDFPIKILPALAPRTPQSYGYSPNHQPPPSSVTQAIPSRSSWQQTQASQPASNPYPPSSEYQPNSPNEKYWGGIFAQHKMRAEDILTRMNAANSSAQQPARAMSPEESQLIPPTQSTVSQEVSSQTNPPNPQSEENKPPSQQQPSNYQRH